MSININPDGLPDVAALEKLANAFFTALPGQNPFPEPSAHPAGLAHEKFNVHAPTTELSDGHGFVPSPPSAIPGFGVSPTAFSPERAGNLLQSSEHTSFAQHPISPIQVPTEGLLGISNTSVDHLDLRNTNHSSIPTHGFNPIPASVAGSGISPSAPTSSKPFNIQEPQTSLTDPHFAGAGKAPHSLAGLGTSPSVSPTGQTIYTTQTTEEKEIEKVLHAIPSFQSSPQIPSLAVGDSLDSHFYFLSTSKFKDKPTLHHSSDVQKELANQKHSQGSLVKPPFDGNIFKKDFPILNEKVNGKPLVWLDNAATTQKPTLVIDRISYFYEHENSNIHRAAHHLAARATDAYESARKKVQLFLNAASANEIIFVRGATEGINLIAKSWGEQFLRAGDEIVVSHLEHHANIVPWQQLAAKKGLKIRVIPVDDDGQIILSEYTKLLNPKTKLVAVTQVSNALGTVTPVKEITALAHAAGAKVLIDGAQSVSHMRVNVQEIGADWFVFSGHKVFGPTGIGVVYGKEELLNETEPWQGGGNMIVDVTFEHTTFHKAPGRFEAGTGNIADAVGLGAAIDYVTAIGMDNIHLYEHYLLVYATQLLEQIPGLRLIGTAAHKASVLSFVFEKFKTEEVGAALNEEGIAVRSGHHCAQPILRRFGLEATVRPSLAFYNTCADVDLLVDVLYKLRGTRPIK